MHTPLTIGVAGHVDHGKTTLVRMLTGIDTDRKAEEKARGLSIESGVAELTLPGGRSVALIDVPGHTDFLKNTIRGLNSVDLALLVVAADDGVMPQTSEHLEILKFFNAASGMVVLTKTDLVDEETVEIAEMEMSDLLTGTFLDKRPILKFSDRKPELSQQIISAIDGALAFVPAKKPDRPFRMWIDQLKSITGHGTVVSGTVASGTIHANDKIELLPAGIQTRGRSLESHGRSVTRAVAGQRVGINLHRVSIDQLGRGMCLAAPGAISPAYMLNGCIQVLAAAGKGLKNNQKVKLYLGTSITTARIVLMQGDRMGPGEGGLVQIRLLKPVPALPRDAFVISPMNVNSVIAGGRVLEVPHEKFRSVKAGSMLPQLTALTDDDLDAYITAVFEETRTSLVTARALSARTGLTPEAFERRISSRVHRGELIYIKGAGAIQKTHLADLENRFKAVVAAAFKKNPLKKNITLGEVAEQLTLQATEPLLNAVADRLCQRKEITRFEGGFLLAGSEAALDGNREQLIALLLDHARTSGLSPFSADAFCKSHTLRFDKPEVRRVLNYLATRKKLARLNDKRFLSLEAIETIKTRVAETIAVRGFVTVGDCKELLGYGRWGGTHVLDYLDDIGFTVRREDKHYLKPAPR